MSTNNDTLFRQASALPETERIRLIETLIETLNPEHHFLFENEWAEVSRKRSEELSSGSVKSVRWSDVKSNAWKSIIE